MLLPILFVCNLHPPRSRAGTFGKAGVAHRPRTYVLGIDSALKNRFWSQHEHHDRTSDEDHSYER